MKLSELSQKPKLKKITINKPELVEKYGDELEFWVYDRQPLDVFTKFANVTESDMASMLDVVTTLILNEKGEQIIKDDYILPMDVMMEATKLLGETLGK